MNESMTSNSKFSSSDFSMSLEPQTDDPVLQSFYQVVTDIVVPIEIRSQKCNRTLNDPGSLEMVRLRILAGNEKQRLQTKLELTSEDNLFFNYVCVVDLKAFNKIKNSQNLTIGYQSFVQMVSKLSTLLHTEKDTHFAILFLRKEGTAHLDFNQNVEYKFIEVLSLNFAQVEQELNKQIVAYRFNQVKRKLQIVNHSVKELSAFLKLKNPSLLQKLSKKSG